MYHAIGLFSYVTLTSTCLALRSENVAWLGVKMFECKSVVDLFNKRRRFDRLKSPLQLQNIQTFMKIMKHFVILQVKETLGIKMFLLL